MPISGRVKNQAVKAVLAAMPEAVRDRMGTATQITASEIVRVAKGKVPVDTGTLRDHIAFSYSPTYIRAKVGITPGTVVVSTGQKLPAKTSVASARAFAASNGVRVLRASHYAHLVEFGGRGGKMPAQPFLYPAFVGQQAGYESRMSAAQRTVLTDLANIGSRFL